MSGELAILGARLTKVGLVLPADLDFDAWHDLGVALGWLHHASRWALADWLNYGEDTFGELAAQATDATGLSYQALADIAWVGRQIPLSRRREKLSFTAHREVAGLPPRAREELLDRAEAEGLRSRDLRELTTGRKSRRERIEEAARVVWLASKPEGDGYHVPKAEMRALAALLDGGEA